MEFSLKSLVNFFHDDSNKRFRMPDFNDSYLLQSGTVAIISWIVCKVSEQILFIKLWCLKSS